MCIINNLIFLFLTKCITFITYQFINYEQFKKIIDEKCKINIKANSNTLSLKI